MSRGGWLLAGATALLLPSLATAAPGLEVKLERVDPDAELRVGTPVQLRITARHAPGGVALLPAQWDLPDVLGERTRERRHQRRRDGEDELDVYRLELVPFEAGLLEVPPLELALGSTVAETDPLLLEVESTLAPEEIAAVSSTAPQTLETLEQMAAGDPPPATVLVPDMRLALVLVGVVVAVLVAAVSWVMWKRRPPRPAPPPPPPPPAHEVALARLDDLAKSKWLDQGAFNPYFTELSALLRSYLGTRYGFDAVERTVDELAEALERLNTPGLDRKALQVLLSEADQIKFAKYQPRREDAERAWGEARQMIQKTRVGVQEDQK